MSKKPTRARYSVTLTQRSVDLLNELKEFTDAETDTEVFRDALRLTYLVMKSQKEGLRLELRDPADPKRRPELVALGSAIPG